MTINDEMKIREMYKSKTDGELQSELERISADPFGTFDFNNTDISHFNLKKVLKEVMGERNLTISNPTISHSSSPYNLSGTPTQNTYSQPNVNRTSNPNVGTIILGVVLFAVGVGITMGSEGQLITYGLIIVGFIKIIQGFIGD